MTKRIIAVFLALITVFSMFTIVANAASYKTGNYLIASGSGSNIRTGAGTGYSKVGAASKGTTFYVSKISGSWGYTSSIKATTGVKSGWVCLDYCTYKGSSNSSRATYNDVFASLKGSGYSLSQARNSEATSFKKGDFVYVWGFLHDANNKLYKTYGSGTCNMTLSIYRPDGSLAHSYTYKNCDNNWIGCKLDRAGTWKIQSKITGSLTGTNTRTITVKDTSKTTYYTLTYNANGGSGAPSSQKVQANTSFKLSTSKPTRSGYTFLGWSSSKNATSASYSAGAKVRLVSNATIYAVWKKNVTVNPTSVSLNYTSLTMNMYNTKQLTATVYPSNATNKTVYWSSNDRAVSVSSTGKLTAIEPGVATITVKTSNGKTKTCKVTVRGVEITGGIRFAYPTVGDINYLSAKAYPSDTTKFTWSTSNSKVVSINSSGKMTAKAAGTATITAKTSDGRSASMNITVYAANKWRTGNFDSGYTAKGYTTVTLNRSAGDAKIKIYTYDMLGWKSSGEVHVTLRDCKGNWICEFDAKSGDTLNLGDNYGQYRVYIAKKRYPDTFFGNDANFNNVGKCVSWAIECTKNCYI
ncbi:MAG: Ig-like domain-containing protein [Clostridia bacterium]|nr:Ig-like domain-containing protein [Clostridia bacterium]